VHGEQGEVYDVRSGDTNRMSKKELYGKEKDTSVSCVQHCLQQDWVLTDVNLPCG